VPLGCVTEFCGVPGIGKTQLGMQLALDVQIPALFGGVAGSAIYIDTEGSFMVSRMRDMAEALVRHLHDLGNNPAKPSTPEMRKALEGVSVDGLLRDVMYYRVHDFVEQVALVNVLPSYLSANSERRFRLIVLDSVAFHFRHHFTDMAQRARVLQTLAQKLQALASEFSLAVVVINQVTTKFKAPEEAYLTPALGESWAHAVTHRVMLYSEGGGRLAHLYKSSSQPRRTAPFRITSRGVRDVADRKRKLPEDDPPNPHVPLGT
jgi:RAD51-like protein 2